MNVDELLTDNDIYFITKGADHLVRCLNPEHEDKNPSMRVDSITGVFQCFSCGFKGNLFTHYGETPNFMQMKRNKLQKRIQETRASSVGLLMPKGASPYIGTWRDIKASTYEAFKAFQHHDPDFIGRVVFPITDSSGKIRAFQGRHMSPVDPKYKVVPQGAVIPMFPSCMPYRGHIILVEGIFDMLNLYDKGLTNVVCIFGTNNINLAKLGTLYMRGAHTIDIFMDGDKAGQKAANRIKAMCEEGHLLSRNICLDDLDPGALTQTQVTKLKENLYG